jgi:hypothetical protein
MNLTRIANRPFLLLVVVLIAMLYGTAAAVPPPGPDAFGHSVSNIPYNLRDVRVTGADIGLDNADDGVAVVPIGFDFSFYGVPYNQVEISSNGFLSFTITGAAACCSGEAIPTAGGDIDNFVAGYWEDLDPSEGGTIRTATLGSAGNREFIVGFYEVRDNDDPTNSINTFEMILHEGTNNIELQYDQIQFEDVDDKVTGIENFDGTDGIELLFVSFNAPLSNGDLLFDKEGYLFITIPEPSSLTLLATLSAGVVAWRRRRCAR